MPYIRHFFVGDKYYGSAEARKRIIHGELQEPQHYAMFCPECGEVWARMPVEGVTTPNWWRIIGGNCRRHPGPSPFVVAGSLMLNWEPELQEMLPEELLREWELPLHFEFWDKL